jgi:SnoaL-like domain
VSRRARAALLFLLGVSGLAGCGGRAAPPVLRLAEDAESAVNDVVVRALEADARQTDPGDSLYAPFATIVSEGRTRLTYPRFAGVDGPGHAAITASQLEVHPTLAWADVDYRWVAVDGATIHPARATFVLAPRGSGGGWWIVHAHSSSPVADPARAR